MEQICYFWVSWMFLKLEQKTFKKQQITTKTPKKFQTTNQHFQKTPNLSKKHLAFSRGCFFNLGSFPWVLSDAVFKWCWYLFDFLRYSMKHDEKKIWFWFLTIVFVIFGSITIIFKNVFESHVEEYSKV